MTESIIVALITGLVTVLGVILSNSKTSAVMQNELKHLTEEVKKHNNFATRVPILEEKISVIEKALAEIERKNPGV